MCARGAEDAELGICAGRGRADGVECWVAVTTEAYAKEIISEMPLFRNGEYVPQTKAVLVDIGNRIWDALKSVLQPFIGTPSLLNPCKREIHPMSPACLPSD